MTANNQEATPKNYKHLPWTTPQALRKILPAPVTIPDFGSKIKKN